MEIAKTIKDYIEAYREKDATSSRLRISPRLPFPLPEEEDTFNRLTAFYCLEVANMGHQAELDAATTDALHKVTHWLCTSQRRGLLLLGTLGNGKTTMLWSIRDLFAQKATRRNAQDIFDTYRENEVCTCMNEPFLLIDDLGAEPNRCIVYGQECQPLTKLLMHRYDRQLTTVIAANLLPSDLQERYGERVYDRMIEMFEFVPFTHPSYRRKA